MEGNIIFIDNFKVSPTPMEKPGSAPGLIYHLGQILLSMKIDVHSKNLRFLYSMPKTYNSVYGTFDTLGKPSNSV